MNILLIIAVAPVALLLIYIYKRDAIEKEPAKMLRKAFGGGCLCVLLDLLIVLPMQAIFGDASEWHGFFWSTFGQAFLEAGIPEELCKFLVLYWLIWKAPDFDEHFDGIVYATFVSMGFACLENILYVFQYGAGTGIMRAVTAVPGHFFFAVVMGYYFSRAKFDIPNRKSNMIKCIIYPMIVHGIYDMILFMMNRISDSEDDSLSYIVGILLIAFFFFNFKLWRHGFRRVKELREKDLADMAQNRRAIDYLNDPSLEFRESNFTPAAGISSSKERNYSPADSVSSYKDPFSTESKSKFPID